MNHKSNRDFVINGKKIEPGQNESLQLHIARLPSGTVINLRVNIFRSKNPGPTILVMGGVHGDEINGVEIVRQSLVNNYFENLKSGSAIVIPILNVYGFINFSRDASEGKDVNRSFPGSMSGSLASRVAATLTKKILPLVDFGIDFHTGGSSRYNYPQIRYTLGDESAYDLAKAFGAPYLIGKPNLAKTLRKVGKGMGIPILVFEGGESLRLDGFSISHGLKGLKRVLIKKGMLEGEAADVGRQLHFNKTSWIRADKSGLFRWNQQSGARVSKGEPLGEIHSPYGESSVTIYAKRSGYLIGHNNAPVISQGDALFHIGFAE